jgi:hypothetical protein
MIFSGLLVKFFKLLFGLFKKLKQAIVHVTGYSLISWVHLWNFGDLNTLPLGSFPSVIFAPSERLTASTP